MELVAQFVQDINISEDMNLVEFERKDFFINSRYYGEIFLAFDKNLVRDMDNYLSNGIQIYGDVLVRYLEDIYQNNWVATDEI